MAHSKCSVSGSYFTSSHLSSCGQLADKLFVGFYPVYSAKILLNAGQVLGGGLWLLPSLAD